MLEQPVFIGGLYKSGTTLLRMMLSQHSDMVSGLETFWFDLNWEDRNSRRTDYVGRRWDGTRDEAPGDQVERLCRYYGLDPVVHASRIDACSSREEFLDFLLTTYAATCGAGRWTEKTPPNILHWERVFRAWPDARFIHMVRDPLDVFTALKRIGKWATPEEFAKLWIRFFSEGVRGEAEAASGSFLVVHYESLIMETEKTMRAVAEFASMPWEESLNGFAGNSDDYDTVLKLTGKSSTTLDRLRQPLTRDQVGIWRGEVAEAEESRIRELVGKAGLAEVFSQALFEGAKHA